MVQALNEGWPPFFEAEALQAQAFFRTLQHQDNSDSDDKKSEGIPLGESPIRKACPNDLGKCPFTKIRNSIWYQTTTKFTSINKSKYNTALLLHKLPPSTCSQRPAPLLPSRSHD